MLAITVGYLFLRRIYVKIHDIRHTAASHLLAGGVDIRIVADILGHSTLQMAMRYTHVFQETKTEEMKRLNHLGFEEKE
ncbi:tyrosine-type recombinase/integrase [Desulfopila sp. IMCC35008]|uniref:tyrosine-type recombinase/integrase n=1 Tax=Desulfopila sp. IMCC35008 TaxID=2653858 RepID=UPI0013D433B6|nr:tyrosine-type recombinase/integrase [Desulfopila sp. IMCC35008]